MDFNDPKVLQKIKDFALDHKFDACPPRLQEYWVEVMWVKGFQMALSYYGYEIVKKDKVE